MDSKTCTHDTHDRMYYPTKETFTCSGLKSNLSLFTHQRDICDFIFYIIVFFCRLRSKWNSSIEYVIRCAPVAMGQINNTLNEVQCQKDRF